MGWSILAFISLAAIAVAGRGIIWWLTNVGAYAHSEAIEGALLVLLIASPFIVCLYALSYARSDRLWPRCGEVARFISVVAIAEAIALILVPTFART